MFLNLAVGNLKQLEYWKTEEVKPLKKFLYQNSLQISKLIENIPGIVLICQADPECTIFCLNHEFLKSTGYTKKEIKQKFHRHYTEMIVPADFKNIYAKAQREQTESLPAYRIMRADGKIRWFSEKRKQIFSAAGISYFFSLLTDVTDKKEKYLKLQMDLERYQIIYNQTNDIVFEWDFLNDTAYFSPNWEKKFGYAPIQKKLQQTIPDSQYVYSQDQAHLQEEMKELRNNGKALQDTEIRIYNANGSYTWCRIRASTQYNQNNEPICAIGILTDISEEKEQQMCLIEQVQRDSLTGLLNKTATEMQVTSHLKSADHSTCALIILDLDYFKTVNDLLGHLYGDAVLKKTAKVIRQIFRETDVTGRIGGDEFLIFIQKINRKTAMQKASLLLQEIQHIPLDSNARTMSCSIGIAFFPQDAQSFADLYRFADHALYNAKRSGRAKVEFYKKDRIPESVCSNLEVDNCRPAQVEHLYADSGQLLQETFRILNSTPDTSSAVHRVLESMSIWFYTSNLYICKFDPLNGDHMLFSWDNQYASLMNLPANNTPYIETMNLYKKALGKQNIYCTEEHKMQNFELWRKMQQRKVMSLMIARMTVCKKPVGMLIAESHTHACWSKERQFAFSQISNLLGLFLIKCQR